MLPLPTQADVSWAYERFRFASNAAAAGELLTTSLAVAEVVARFPDDPALLHQASAVHAAAGDYPQAMAYLLQADATHPGDVLTQMAINALDRLAAAPGAPFVETEPPIESAAIPVHAVTASAETPLAAAFAARAEGQHRHAMELLEAVRSQTGLDASYFLALAELYIFHHDRPAAVALLRGAIEQDIDDPAIFSLFFALLNETGAYGELVDQAAALGPDFGGSPMRTMIAHARLALRFDRPALVAAATVRTSAPIWVDAAQVAAQLRQVVVSRTPFALTRFGDGEGRFLAYTDPDSQIAPADRAAIGNSIWRNWFGTDITDERPAELSWLRADVLAAFGRADLLGVSVPSRLAVDGAHFGYLATLEPLADARATLNPAGLTCDALVHLDLHRQSPFYRAILEGVEMIGVVSPHAGLPEQLARHLGIPGWIELTIPGEHRLPAEARRHGTHFPQLYRAALAAIKVPKPGTVYLVAGGLLGKVYCDRVRTLGGIAIDVGSLVDGWMGYNTRPGALDDRASWILPS